MTTARVFHFIVLCDKELTTSPGALFLFILSQIWLLGNTELRSKLANSCSPGSGRQGFEENHHVAYVFYASEKQIKSFLVFFWDSDNHAHFLGALPDAHGCRCASTEPTFCLFTFLPEALISLDLTTHSLPRFSPHRFILHAAVRLTILKHVFFFFTGHFPCQRNCSHSLFTMRWSSNMASNTLPNKHLSISQVLLCSEYSPPMRGCSFIFPLFIYLFIKETIIECQLYARCSDR